MTALPTHGPNPDKAARKARLAHNRRNSLARLDEAGIRYEVTTDKGTTRNEAYTAEGPDGTVVFYPSTGAWFVNATKASGRGVFGLIGHLRGEGAECQPS